MRARDIHTSGAGLQATGHGERQLHAGGGLRTEASARPRTDRTQLCRREDPSTVSTSLKHWIGFETYLNAPISNDPTIAKKIPIALSKILARHRELSAINRLPAQSLPSGPT